MPTWPEAAAEPGPGTGTAACGKGGGWVWVSGGCEAHPASTAMAAAASAGEMSFMGTSIPGSVPTPF
jgi:hypothetical protein